MCNDEFALDRASARPALVWLCTGLFLSLAAVFVRFHPVALKPLVGLFSLLPLALLARRLSRLPLLSRPLCFIGQSILVIYCLDFVATPLTIRPLRHLNQLGTIPTPLLISLTLLYVPLAISLLSFLRLLYLENLRPSKRP